MYFDITASPTLLIQLSWRVKTINGFSQKHTLKVFELREKHYFWSKQRVERCIVLKGTVSKWFCYFWTHVSHFLSLLRWSKYYYFFDEFRKSFRMACFVWFTFFLIHFSRLSLYAKRFNGEYALSPLSFQLYVFELKQKKKKDLSVKCISIAIL